MAHWSSGYADFHDELYAEPSTPFEPPLLHCTDCDATFTELAELRQHVFATHPTAHPGLTFRGKTCGDARLLVQNITAPSDWITTNTTWTQIDDLDVAPMDFGAQMSRAQGVTDVRLGNDRSNRKFSFDFAVPTSADLRGVDDALGQLIDNKRLDASSISSFIDGAHRYPTARNYTDGIAEYLYWLSGRQTGVDAATSMRNHDKLNRAAHLLGDVPRPAARAITSLISLYFNHFGEAADRALSPRLRDLAQRMDRMLSARTRPEDRAGIEGRMSPLELLLADRLTADLIKLCSLPLDSTTTTTVSEFDCPGTDARDLLKYHLFTAEHHLATGDPRAIQFIRTGSKNGLPEHWVNARLDLLTHKGSTWPKPPAIPAQTVTEATPSGSRETGSGNRPKPTPPANEANRRTAPRSRTSAVKATPESTPPAMRSRVTGTTPRLDPDATPRIANRTTIEAKSTAPGPIHQLPPIRRGLGATQTHSAVEHTLATTPTTSGPPPEPVPATPDVASTPPWSPSPRAQNPRRHTPNDIRDTKKSLLKRLLSWNK
ncbi:hypothetical protein A4U94_21540 [Prescottella equi]|uniref:hypothetical protein n=1 Tax=Rhodococcus hoagii TaxID=43767 RepID=UPI0009C12DD5|nr:hypothetical protein [Prescottella equi]OQQ26370.1 hypothetical protein A4U94_21540 [Prescottella equi]